MRILIVTSQFPIAGEPNRGRPILQTVRELAQLASVRVVSPIASYPDWARPRSYLFRHSEPGHRVEGCEVDYVPYYALPLLSRPLNGMMCARALHAPLAAFEPDVVLSYWLYPDAYGAMLAARRAGIPLVAGARGSDIRVRDAISRRLTRSVVTAAQRLLVVSEDLGRLAASEYGADPARVRAISNGCDAAIFRPTDRAVARRKVGVAQDAELVLYAGRLVIEKGLRELIDATRKLAGSRPRLQVVLIGEGPLQAELESLIAADPSLPVRLVGAQPPSVVAQWMAASDAVTLPSYSEGHPNVLVEALACGRAVVATPVGGVPEVVDGESGVLVPARDAVALAEGLAQALERQWDERALSRKFSRDWHQVACETLQACEEAVSEASGATARAGHRRVPA